MSQNHRRLVPLALSVLFSVALAAPTAAHHVERLNLTLTNRLPSAGESIAVTVSGFSLGCRVDFAEPALAGRTVRLNGFTIITIAPCGAEAWSQTFKLPGLAAGGYTVEVWIDGTLHLVDGFAVQTASNALSFHDGAFSAVATWKNPYDDGGEGEGHPIQLGGDSGAFWFFAPGNVELTIKVLDGRPVNGHWWVFLTGMSTVEYTVTVTECPTNPLLAIPCRSKSYRNPPFVNRNFIDVEAF